MITGFNTNVRHKGLLFHVQTEDSGRALPHLISHVYHGGTILASHKSDYADRIDSENLDQEVRVLMEAQHKAMISRLEQGEFDDAIAQRITQPAGISDAGFGADTDALASTAAEAVSSTAATAATPPIEESGGASVKAARAAGGEGGRTFGEGIVSKKPLDEVILEYLVEKARAPRSKG